MNALSNTQNKNLNFDYQALDQFLSEDLTHQDLRYWLNEIEAEILTPIHDGTDLVVDDRVWGALHLLKDLLPTQPLKKSDS